MRRACRIPTRERAKRVTAGVTLAFWLGAYSQPVLGDLAAVDAAESQARNAAVQHFTKFMEDKNVMGPAADPNGKETGGGKKTRFDNDGGKRTNFQADVTYHDFAYDVTETIKGDDGGAGGAQAKAGGAGGNGKNKADNSKTRTLHEFVSSHGKIDKAGGSSRLEREVYKFHDIYSKAEEDPANQEKAKADAEKGIKFFSIFKEETRDVAKDGQDQGQQGQNGKGGQGKGDKGEVDKVSRLTIRDEVRPAIEKIGEDSFETISKSAKNEEDQDDPDAMPTLGLLWAAASRATESLWNRTMQKLGQRRANTAIRGGILAGQKPQLSEKLYSCQQWAQVVNQKLAEVQQPEVRKQLQEELAKVNQECQQVTKVDIDYVAPAFESKKGGKAGEEELTSLGVQKEDGIQRDLRVELNVLAKAGKLSKDVQSNWKYDKKDDEAKVTIDYDEKGQPTGTRQMTVKDQMDSYNDQLREALKGYDDVKSRYPDLKAEPQAIYNQYSLKDKAKSVMDLNQMPETFQDDYGNTKGDGWKAPQNYDELIQKAE